MILLGTSGWYYSHWIDRFYPKSLEKNKWLEFYSREFDTVEINSTFYRFPFDNMFKGWYNKTPKNFVFSLKANRLITHVKRLRNAEQYLDSFYKQAKFLKEKCGSILFQFPPSMKKDVKLLSGFMKQLPKRFDNVIEFRNETWHCEEVYETMRKHKVGYCIISGLGQPCNIISTADFAYIRWHGPSSAYSSEYSMDEMKQWAETIKKLNCKTIYGYFNNDSNCYAVKNCRDLKRLLNK
jgi:uncharacterized protein YecE (DUF72 family)